MAPTERELVVTKLVEAFNQRQFADYVAGFHDDAIIEYPQSGERVQGRRQMLAMFTAFAGPPTFRAWRTDSAGDLVVVHAAADYPGMEPWFVVIEFQFAGALIARETAYFGAAFAPAEWRKPFVHVAPFV